MIIDASHYPLEETPWSQQAACRGVPNPDWFFPERGASTAEARAVCADCPVQPDCLDYAVRWKISHGIWGGLSTRERQRLTPTSRIRPLPAPHGTTTRYARGCRCETCTEANWAYKLRHQHEIGAQTMTDHTHDAEAGHLGGLDQVLYLVILFLFVLVLLRVLKLV